MIRFIGELLATIGRAGVSGPVTVRADSGFWSWKLIDKLNRADVGWSITVRLVAKVNNTIAAIPDEDWVTIDYDRGGHAQVAETIHRPGSPPRPEQNSLRSDKNPIGGFGQRLVEIVPRSSPESLGASMQVKRVVPFGTQA